MNRAKNPLFKFVITVPESGQVNWMCLRGPELLRLLVFLISLSPALAFCQVSKFRLSETGDFGDLTAGMQLPLCEDMETLTVGLLGGQVSGRNIDWLDPFRVGTEVFDSSGNLRIRYTNVSGNDTFNDIFEAVVDPDFVPLADEGFTLAMDYSLSDLITEFFFTPIAIEQEVIFTRLGDVDNDGDWDVLETDGMGSGVFFDTGEPIPLFGTIVFNIVDLSLEISVNKNVIYTGGIIGSNGDPGITPGESLTNIDWESPNNSVGIGSVLTIDNLSINDGCPNLCEYPPGDVTQSGTLDLLDVAPFIELLVEGKFLCEADINQDGVTDLLDVDPFVSLLAGD